MIKWDKQEREYWDVGEESPFLSLSQKKLAGVMMALIRCEGQLHDSHCSEKRLGSSRLSNTPQFCMAMLRISLPKGAKEDFERISGMTLTQPPKVSV